MKLLLVPLSLLLVFLAPAAGAAAPAGCTQLLDSAGACVEDGCYSVWLGTFQPEVCPQVVAGPGCEEGEVGACTYSSNGDRCVRVQLGHYHIEECVSPRAQPRAAVAPCTPPVSQFGACVQNGCAIVDGPMMHEEACAGSLIGDIGYCTPGVSQWVVCVDLPCSTLDGPMIHRDVCLAHITL